MRFRRTAYVSGVLLFLLILATLCPIYLVPEVTEAATKNPNPSTLTFAFTDNRNTASVSLAVTDKNGNFATSTDSQKASFSLSTNNATGYTLNLRTTGTTTTLSDGTHSINTISTGGITADNFTVNTYGILPSKYNGTDNTGTNPNYYPASSTGFKMDETSAANTTANTYTVGLGLKANYATAAGTYTTANTSNGNTGASLVLEYVANAVTYSINYYTNTTATVTGMPSINPQTGTVAQGTTSTSVNLASAPSRTGYTFVGWCKGTNATTSNITVKTDGTPDVCNSTSYDASQSFGIDATVSPDTYYLFAMWKRNSYTCTKQYRLENADGTWGSYTGDGTEQVLYGATCNYSKTETNYKNSASGTNNTAASTSGTMGTSGLTLQVSLYRNTYTLGVSSGSNITASSITTSPVHGANYYRWGQSVGLSATKASNVTCTSYGTPSWSANAGTNPSAGATTTYTMPTSNTAITVSSTATAIKQIVNFATSNASGITFNGSNYVNGDSVNINCGTYNIATNGFPTGYKFSSWGVSGSLALGSSTTTASNTVTVSGTGTLTLNGVINQYTCTKRYRLQNADGTWGSYTTESSPSMNYGSTCSYSKTVTDYKNSASGTNGSQASGSCTVGTSGCTVSLDFYRNTYTLTVNRNTTYISSASASTAAVHGSNYYRWGQGISISASLADFSAFNGWSVSSGSSGSFTSASSSSTTYTMPKGASTIYANGKWYAGQCTSASTCMQTYTKSMCQSGASSGNVTLMDGRDGKTYTARYINGVCWMTQNLRVQGLTVTPALSNVATDYALPASNATADFNSYTTASVYCPGSTTTGCWYNFYATSAGTISGNDNPTNSTYDICPRGWRLPTLSEAETVLNYRTAFSPVQGGFRYMADRDWSTCDPSTGVVCGPTFWTERGFWWTSTSYSQSNGRSPYRYYLRDNTSSTDGAFGLSTQKDGGRQSGDYIRCVRAS